LGAEGSGIEGTGIGLALTKQMVIMMGGRVGFTSTPDEGSSFWIDLPIHKESD
jgi:signal transduction histidine kinase